MNILDENIPRKQRQLLATWGILIRQVGVELARKGIQDADILPLLLSLGRPTFFTLDMDFCRADWGHQRYCLVFLDVRRDEAAIFIRRLLRQPQFNTQVRRMGTVIRASREGLSVWRLYATQETHYSWIDADGKVLSSVVREDEGLYVVAYPELHADLGSDQG